MARFGTMRAALAALLLTVGAAHGAEKELLIGQNDALSGGGAVYGLPQQKAVQLAVEEVNAKGGVKIGADNYKLKVIAYDDKANPPRPPTRCASCWTATA